MYNFMTLYIAVINLLVQNNVFNFLEDWKWDIQCLETALVCVINFA